MSEQLRRIFIIRDGREFGPTDMISVNSGEIFRMEPPLGVDDDVGCPTHWLIANSDGYIRDGIQRIDCASYSDHTPGELP